MARAAQSSPAPTGPSLADVPPGTMTRVTAWLGFSSARRQQLLAYGLAVGTLVRVVQQTAATVVLIEHTELALERDLARLILVEGPPKSERRPFGD